MYVVFLLNEQHSFYVHSRGGGGNCRRLEYCYVSRALITVVVAIPQREKQCHDHMIMVDATAIFMIFPVHAFVARAS